MATTIPELSTIEPHLVRFIKQVDEGVSLANFNYVGRYRGLVTKAAFGMGARSRVPWFGVFADGLIRPSEGSYPVVLYYKAAKILVVAYGVGEARTAQSAWGGLDFPTIAEELPRLFSHRPERYGSSLMAGAFSTARTVNFAEVAALLDGVVDRYIDLQRLATVQLQQDGVDAAAKSGG